QMYPLISGGYVYVAQPPLFRVKSKKQSYYVQTEEEMKSQLMEVGLADAVFEPGDGRTIEGEQMARLCRTLSAIEDSLVALERRGISLRTHAVRQDPLTGKLPVYHVFVGGNDRWFVRRDEMEAFVESQEEAAGGELTVADQPAVNAAGAGANGPGANGDG